MRNLEIDFKLIIITLCISLLMGAVIWAGYNVYTSFTKDENEEEIKFEEDMYLSGRGTIEIKEKDLIDEEFFMQPTIEKKFKINNEKPNKVVENWATVTVNHEKAGYSTQYSIPYSTENLKGENIQAGVFNMNTWTEDGTYEDFIQDFIEELKSQENGLDWIYSTRQINISGKEYMIITRKSKYASGSYFCLAQNGYACFLEIITYNNYYDNNLEKTINKIFSTFTII